MGYKNNIFLLLFVELTAEMASVTFEMRNRGGSDCSPNPVIAHNMPIVMYVSRESKVTQYTNQAADSKNIHDDIRPENVSAAAGFVLYRMSLGQTSFTVDLTSRKQK